jgi:hypothetical protein
MNEKKNIEIISLSVVPVPEGRPRWDPKITKISGVPDVTGLG